jgi:hypothetical protein
MMLPSIKKSGIDPPKPDQNPYHVPDALSAPV